MGTPQGTPEMRKNTSTDVFFLISGQDLAGSWQDLGGTCTRSWEGLTARGGLDGPHLGHPLRRDQVRGSAHAQFSLTPLHSPLGTQAWYQVAKPAERENIAYDGFAAG